jgi:uncharacterized short protein YbdD (DUF466 family)
MHLLEIRLASIAQALRAMLGAPDYERYLAHLIETHPGCEPMTRDEFMKVRMNEKYCRPGSRCC